MDVAREIGVSDASIIRFSRAIGYKGFTDLKMISITLWQEKQARQYAICSYLTVLMCCPGNLMTKIFQIHLWN